jgi:hypothetical protein
MLDRFASGKAFNYYEDKNFLTAFFHGDSTFLYTLFEISAMELISKFRFELEKRIVYVEAKEAEAEEKKQKNSNLKKDGK